MFIFYKCKFLIALFSHIFIFYPQAKAENFIIDSIESGLSEKGFYFGINKKIKEKNKLGFGLNYLDSNVVSFFPDQVQGQSIELKNIGARIILKRYINNPKYKNRFFLGLTGELSKFNISSTRNLKNEIIKDNDFIFSCSACGNLILSNQSDEYIFIPSLILGYERSLTKKINLNISGGYQYFDIPKISWKTDTNLPPDFIISEFDRIVSEVNNSTDNISEYFPTLFFTLSYKL